MYSLEEFVHVTPLSSEEELWHVYKNGDFFCSTEQRSDVYPRLLEAVVRRFSALDVPQRFIGECFQVHCPTLAD